MTTAIPKRPKLLTVICILSFIYGLFDIGGCVWSGSGGYQHMLENQRTQTLQRRDQYGPDDPLVKLNESQEESNVKMAEHVKPFLPAFIALDLLSIVGVWLMWKLRKVGFWLYLTAAVLWAVLVLMPAREGGMSATIMSVFMVFVTLVFITLYGMNLKHMR